MRKYVAALAAVLAVLTALTVSPVARATACADGYYYAGYGHTNPAQGGHYSVDIKDWYDAVPGGHIAAWVGVNNSDNSKWVQAGLAKLPTGGLAFYIEANSGTGPVLEYWDETAQQGVSYTATISHPSLGVWTASINGHSWTVNLSSIGLTATAEVWNQGGTCDSIDFGFTNSTYSVASMTGNTQTSPYYLLGGGTYGWVSYGP